MDDFYSRTEILIGRDAMARLKNGSVAICGIGGVGSYAAEAIARAGIGKITLADHDTIAESNLNRQIHALRGTLGRAKTDVMCERILDINPRCAVSAIKIFITPDNACTVFNAENPPDYVIDAVDNIPAKLALIKEAGRRGVKIISAMGAANRVRPELLEITDIYKTAGCPLAKAMRKELKKLGIASLLCCASGEKPARPEPERPQTLGSVSFVPAAAGLMIAGHVIREMINWESS